MVNHDDLPDELFCHGWRVVGCSCYVSAVNVGLCDASDVHAYVVAWFSHGDLCVVHFDGFNFSSLVTRHKDEGHSRFQYSCLDSANWDGADSGDAVDILYWNAQRLVGGFW